MPCTFTRNHWTQLVPSQCQDVGGWMEGWVEGRVEGKKERRTNVDKPFSHHFPSSELTYATSYTQKSLKSVVLNQEQFYPQGALGNVWRHF